MDPVASPRFVDQAITFANNEVKRTFTEPLSKGAGHAILDVLRHIGVVVAIPLAYIALGFAKVVDLLIQLGSRAKKGDDNKDKDEDKDKNDVLKSLQNRCTKLSESVSGSVQSFCPNYEVMKIYVNICVKGVTISQDCLIDSKYTKIDVSDQLEAISLKDRSYNVVYNNFKDIDEKDYNSTDIKVGVLVKNKNNEFKHIDIIETSKIKDKTITWEYSIEDSRIEMREVNEFMKLSFEMWKRQWEPQIDGEGNFIINKDLTIPNQKQPKDFLYEKYMLDFNNMLDRVKLLSLPEKTTAYLLTNSSSGKAYCTSYSFDIKSIDKAQIAKTLFDAGTSGVKIDGQSEFVLFAIGQYQSSSIIYSKVDKRTNSPYFSYNIEKETHIKNLFKSLGVDETDEIINNEILSIEEKNKN